MMRQSDNSMVQGDQVYGYLPEGYLLDDQSPDYNGNKTRWARAQADSFAKLVSHSSAQAVDLRLRVLAQLARTGCPVRFSAELGGAIQNRR